jgi:hypothetical protein
MRRLALVLGLPLLGLPALSGCAQLFGLDETSEATDSAARLSVKRYAVGTQVVVQPMELTGGAATYLIADPLEPTGFRQVPATSTEVGVWQGDVPVGTPAQLSFTVADDLIRRHLAIPDRSVAYLYGYLGKVTPAEPPPPAAQLGFAVAFDRPFDAATDDLHWLSIGSWTQYNFNETNEVPTGSLELRPPPVPFTSASSLSGRPHERLRADDALLVLRNTATAVNTRVLTGAYTAPPFELAADLNALPAGAMTAVAADQMLAVTLDTDLPVTRMANARPVVAPPAYNWSVTAAPGAAAGFTTGPGLAFGGLVPGGVVPLSVPYGNPFAERSWPATFTWAATSLRTYTPEGQPPVVLTALLVRIASAPSDGGQLDFGVCLPLSVTVQGAVLNTDGATIAIDRTKPVAVSFSTDNGTADLFSIVVHEVVSGTVTTLVPRFHSVNRQTSWSLPADVFEAGKSYSVRAHCHRDGFPNQAAGDFETRQLPTATGFLDGGVFTVSQ